MQDYRQRIKQVFDGLKCKNKGDALKIFPIFDDGAIPCGYLRPVTMDYCESIPNCAELLAKWRNENPTLSAEPFLATAEGTRKWLDELILGRDDRILFLIIASDGTKVGHIGFSSFSYDERCCEVDAVVRGEKNLYPGMMTFALRSLLAWGIRDLKLLTIRLRVFSDNGRAIRFYERNGFSIEQEGIPTHPPSQKVYTGMRLGQKAWDAMPPGTQEVLR